jgi:hypothetical protein
MAPACGGVKGTGTKILHHTPLPKKKKILLQTVEMLLWLTYKLTLTNEIASTLQHGRWSMHDGAGPTCRLLILL